MTSTLKKVTQEEILLPLRELYRRDSEQRELIAKYAKSFFDLRTLVLVEEILAKYLNLLIN